MLPGLLLVRNLTGEVRHRGRVNLDPTTRTLLPIDPLPSSSQCSPSTDCLTFRLDGTRVHDEVSVEVTSTLPSVFQVDAEDIQNLQAHPSRRPGL